MSRVKGAAAKLASAIRPSIIAVFTWSCLGVLLPGQALATVTTAQVPRKVRVGHSDVNATQIRQVYYVVSGPSSTDVNRNWYVELWVPGVQSAPARSYDSGSTQPLSGLIDVVDLDGDGRTEVVGYHDGDACTSVQPILYILNHDLTVRTRYLFPAKTNIGPGIKIYDVAGTNPVQRRVVVVPNTFALCPSGTVDYANSSSTSSVKVVFFNSNGTVLATPSVEGSGSPPGGREITTFPGVVAGNIDGFGGNEILVIVKSRVLLFNENGGKIWYKQFVDSSVTIDDIGYNPEKDLPLAAPNPADWDPWSGRRYGVYRLVNVDTDANRELVIAADLNPIISSRSPGAVYETYDIPLTPGDGYLGTRLYQTWIRNSTVNATPAGWPKDYQLGTPADGIDDTNGDGIVDIVTTELVSGTPRVRVINARTGYVSTPSLNAGLCLDTKRLSSTGTFKDFIVWKPGLLEHHVWRVQTQGSLSLTDLGAFATGSSVLVKEEFGSDLVLNQDQGVAGVNGHFAVNMGRETGFRQIASYTAQDCAAGAIGLQAWSASSTVVTKTLDLYPRPGRITDILKAADPNNFVWLLEPEPSCGTRTHQLQTRVQSSGSLVPSNEL